jgi:conjugative relaxase-like TrwC/TraI family protein
MNASISARLASGSPVPRARWPSRRWGSTTAPRADDPLLHTHLVVANRVQDPDGRWTALDGRDLYRHRRAADTVYRAAYQRELTRSLGVAWTAADRHVNREFQGTPAELLRGFSKRAEQVTAEVERLEATGRARTPRLVQWAVHATARPSSMRLLRPSTRWRADAAERGRHWHP